MAGLPISTRRASASRQRRRTRDRGEVHRLHALARAPEGDVDDLAADPGRLAVRPERDRRPADQADLRQVDPGQHNVYIADLMPTLFWTDAMFVISQKILGGSMKGAQSGDLADRSRRSGRSRTRTGQALHDLGEGPQDGVTGNARAAGAGGADAEGAAVGAVPLLRAVDSLLAFIFALPDRQGGRFLDAPRPGASGPFIGLDNYRNVIDDPTFRDAARHSALLLLAVPALLVISVAGVGAAVRPGARRGGSIAACCSCRTSWPCRSSASWPVTCSRCTASSTTCSRRSDSIGWRSTGSAASTTR